MDSPRTPPDQVQLDPRSFPAESWVRALVDAFNKLAVQARQALTIAGPRSRTIAFKTSASVAASFPIDVPVDAVLSEIRVAQVLKGAAGATFVHWAMLPRGAQASGLTARITSITGLSDNTSYELRLAIE